MKNVRYASLAYLKKKKKKFHTFPLSSWAHTRRWKTLRFTFVFNETPCCLAAGTEVQPVQLCDRHGSLHAAAPTNDTFQRSVRT